MEVVVLETMDGTVLPWIKEVRLFYAGVLNRPVFVLIEVGETYEFSDVISH